MSYLCPQILIMSAIHNKDYSVVKTSKAGLTTRLFLLFSNSPKLANLGYRRSLSSVSFMILDVFAAKVTKK